MTELLASEGSADRYSYSAIFLAPGTKISDAKSGNRRQAQPSPVPLSDSNAVPPSGQVQPAAGASVGMAWTSVLRSRLREMIGWTSIAAAAVAALAARPGPFPLAQVLITATVWGVVAALIIVLPPERQ